MILFIFLFKFCLKVLWLQKDILLSWKILQTKVPENVGLQ
ncbi:hypothetical protein CIPAW_07G086600 [Carya illinoinensis]|uniref:Uncharacterized protein n=1 Tax=Carya illinoinensis TaxID=32201 RepID=A0A8T1Q0C6_CARIL|nr:hypothetical protein CIPAW_07G086600 [Carya illinoinensis]